MTLDPNQATLFLRRIAEGDSQAARDLLPLLYDELRSVAERCMAHQPAEHTLQPTALVHEAYVRLFGGQESPHWSDRAHFVRVAAQAMRHVLVDHARAKKAQKRGDGERPVPLEAVLAHFEEQSLDVISLDEALERLAKMDVGLSRIVELRFFAGLTIEETARALDVSATSVERGWRVARMWLREQLPRAG